MMNESLSQIIAGELNAQTRQVTAAITLLDEGNTVPFIARYRKEVTGGLDDTQLRQLETRLSYLRELNDRRRAILKSIEEQGKLTLSWRERLTALSAKQSWKTSTCLTNPSAAHADRLRRKPVWNRWQTRCGRIRHRIRKSSPPPMWTAKKGLPTPKPPSTAPATS